MPSWPFQDALVYRDTSTPISFLLISNSKLRSLKPNITSHSFRIGYLSQLWKDTKDVEFVRQTIGHRSLNATSSYVSEMGDEERQDRISRINN